jgi:4-hydroxybutyrate CoA-transferase
MFSKCLEKGNVDVLPLAFSDLLAYFKKITVRRNVWLFCEMGPPNEDGFCNTGYSAPFPLSLYEKCKVVGLINDKMPTTYGNTAIHVSVPRYFVQMPSKLPLYPKPISTKVTDKIGYNVAELITDGSTIQLGVGSIISSIIGALSTKKKLYFSGGFLPEDVMILLEKNVIKDVCSCNATGAYSNEFYTWLDNNHSVEVRSSDYSHNIITNAQKPLFTSITSAISIDLLGQVASETIGTSQISGIGGGLDFSRAAHMGDGKSIVVMASTFGKNHDSKIIPAICDGNVVSLTRHDVDYVITEYGVAELKYKSRSDKTLNLINIAHPNHKDWLHENATKMGLI